MLTLKLKINSCSDSLLMSNYIDSYSFAFRKLYSNPELLQDPTFLSTLENEHICSYAILCLKKDVETKLAQYETQESKKQKELIRLEHKLEIKSFTTKKELKLKYKIIQKIIYLKQTIGKNICFGGKSLLRKITKLKQNIQKGYFNEFELQEKQLILDRSLIEYKQNRKLPFYIVGEQTFKSNRKINFNLTNKKLVFKPKFGTKINFTFFCGNNQQKILNKLQNNIGNQPITVSFTSEYIYLTYDEIKLSAIPFDKKNLKLEQSKAISKEQSKEIYKTLKKEHDLNLLSNKISNRIAAVDLNPNFIGLSIVDYTDTQQVVLTKCYNFEVLNAKTGKNSVDNKYQTNKRKHEIIEVYKDIFKICDKLKVGTFSIEDLNFKETVIVNNVEFNRQTKNIWCRELQLQQIKKHCNLLGIKLVEVEPVYSSFIGNMIYNFYDPISASIELGRRGFYKYVKGNSFFDSLSKINQEKLYYLLGENIDVLSWKDLYSKIKDLPYRNKVVSKSSKFKHKKSQVFCVE